MDAQNRAGVDQLQKENLAPNKGAKSVLLLCHTQTFIRALHCDCLWLGLHAKLISYEGEAAAGPRRQPEDDRQDQDEREQQ